jgi:hypothetical protein
MIASAGCLIANRILSGEPPLRNCGEFLLKKSIGVGQAAREFSGQRLLKQRSVARPGHHAHEAIRRGHARQSCLTPMPYLVSATMSR